MAGTDSPPAQGPGPGAPGDVLFVRGAVLLLLGVVVYLLVDSVSPYVFGAALGGLLLLSLRGIRFEVCVAFVFGLLFLSYVFSTLASLLWPFVASIVLAYLLDPLVGLLSRRIPRTAAIAVIAFLVLGGLSLAAVALIPRILVELRDFVELLPSYGRYLRQAYAGLVAWLDRFGYSDAALDLQQQVLARLPEVGQIFADQTTTLLRGLTSGLAALLNLLMIPFVTYYVLKDFVRIRQALREALPLRHRARVVDFLRQADAVLGQYVRGQLMVSTFIAALTALGLALSGLRYALVLGLLAGALNLIPYVGLAISLGIALLVAALDGNALAQGIKVIGVFVVVQGIEGNVLSPRVVGKKVGLHPVWVMFALVVAASFWGLLGMVLAIPVAAVVNIVVSIAAQRYYGSSYYGGEPPD